MLKVVGRRVPPEIEITVDYYIPLTINCLDRPLYMDCLHWRTGNSSSRVLDIWIDPDNGSFGELEIICSPKIDYKIDSALVQQIEQVNSTFGIPRFDISESELSKLEDKTGYFEIIFSQDNLIIKFTKNISLSNVIYIENLKFGISDDCYLVLVILTNITKTK